MTTIPWRESARSKDSKYSKPTMGHTREEYGMVWEDIPDKSKIEGFTRYLSHQYNNQAISAVTTGMKKAAEAGTPYDWEAELHNFRWNLRTRIMEGTLGVRESRTVAEVDELTRRMQSIANARLLAQVPEGHPLRAKWPTEINSKALQTVMFKSGKTLGEMISGLLAAKGEEIRAQAEAELAEEARKRAEAAASLPADDAAAELVDLEDYDEAAE